MSYVSTKPALLAGALAASISAAVPASADVWRPGIVNRVC
jgi:hypothetical protein